MCTALLWIFTFSRDNVEMLEMVTVPQLLTV